MRAYVCHSCATIYGVMLPNCECCGGHEMVLAACGFCESIQIAEIKECEVQWYVNEGYESPA